MKLTTILAKRRFLPLFLTQFLGAFNDNFFKTAVVILVTYRTSNQWNIAPNTLVTMSGALFIFPYILFCASAGKIADKFDKAMVARLIKYAEVVFMLLAAIGFYFHLVGFLFVVLFCMGTHSAFFSPVKYALLPEHLHEDELVAGNAYIEACTFIAILLGTMIGGSYILAPHGDAIVSLALIATAVIGVLTSQFIPVTSIHDKTVYIQRNVFRETYDILRNVLRDKELRKTSLANSWFWYVGMTFLTLIPVFTREILHADEQVVTRFLGSFSVGIGLGAIACSQLLKGTVSTHYVRFSAIGMSVFALDLAYISPHALIPFEHVATAAEFFSQPSSWRMALDLFLIAFFGGFYMVPLYAALQKQSKPELRAQVMACNNIVNAFFMILSSLAAFIICLLGYSVVEVFIVTAILNGCVALLLFTSYGKFNLTEAY